MNTNGAAKFWRPLSNSTIQCLLCSHACVLEDNEFGHCMTRKNCKREMVLPYYACISSIAIDPIEKKPLQQFMPESWTYSIGFWNCTMDCPFCQNWEIAHPRHIVQEKILPDKLIEMARASGCPSISFTYSEPTLHIEYILESMQLAHMHGLKTVLVTNGNVLPEPATTILQNTDATNIDLKSSSPDIYRNVLGGDIKVVKNFIKIASKLCHTEITSLAVPGILDTPQSIEEISTFIASISEEIPLHITRYHPAWKYHYPALPSSLMAEMDAIAKRHLKSVYTHF